VMAVGLRPLAGFLALYALVPDCFAIAHLRSGEKLLSYSPHFMPASPRLF
jgi:hypothetical protein